MIYLFRKNRKKLISATSEKGFSTKVSRYFAYGVGEIILVVIGILIALQIDTWRERQKQHQQEVYILNRFVADLNKDIKQFDNHIVKVKKRLSNIDSIAKMLENPEKVDKRRFVQLQFELMIDDYFIPARGTYDEGVSSGKLTYIKNDQLREQIFNYYAAISSSRDNDNVQYKVTNELILPIFVEEIGTTKAFAQNLLKANNQLPDLDINSLAKSKNYYKLLLYATGESYQLRDWKYYKTLASSLKLHIEQTLELYL